jgi:predicted N-acetyltransferase YhbS
MQIRTAHEDDVPAITALINQAFVVEAFFKIGDRTSRDRVRELMRRGGHFLRAEDGDTPIGCVLVKAKGETGYFGMLSVDPEMQGRGLGRALIEASEAHLQSLGCTRIEIEVVNLREELPPFYERFGYVKMEERPFPDPERASQPCHFIVMTKKL